MLSSLPGFKNFQPRVELGDGGESLVGQAAAHGDVQFAEIGEPERWLHTLVSDLDATYAEMPDMLHYK